MLYSWRFIDQVDGQLFVLWPRLAKRYAEEDINYSPALIFDLLNFSARGGSDKIQFLECDLRQPDEALDLAGEQFQGRALSGFDRAGFAGSDQAFYYRGTHPFRFSDEPNASAYLLDGVRRLFASLPVHPAILAVKADFYERHGLAPKSYDAVHVRRGDVFDMLTSELPVGLGAGLTAERLSALVGHYVKRTAPLEFYFSAIERALEEGRRLIVTSDSPDTIAFLKARYGKAPLIDLSNLKMRIPIQKAFLDFLILCDAGQITGTASNFSMTPAEIGNVKLHNVAASGELDVSEGLFRRKFIEKGKVDGITADQALSELRTIFTEYRELSETLSRSRERRIAADREAPADGGTPVATEPVASLPVQTSSKKATAEPVKNVKRKEAAVSDNYLDMMDYYKLPRSGIIHVGANYAGEAKAYNAYGKVPIAFVEAVPSLYDKACASTAPYPMQRVFNACCTDRNGDEVTFNVSSNRGMSSSIYPLGRHGELSPGITYVESFTTTTTRLDTLLDPHYKPDQFNLAVIDTQGADLVVLKGFGKFLDHVDAAYIEISDVPLYEGGATFDQIYQYLKERGFVCAYVKLTDSDWGNAFFKRREPVYAREAESAVSIGKPATMSSQHAAMSASLGNDGDVKSRRKFFHTKNEANPWWQVDLEKETPIRNILLFDRNEQRERANTLYAAVSLDGETWERVYERKNEATIASKAPTSIAYRGKARYVRVGLDETNFLHLTQVAVIEDETAHAGDQ